MGIVAARLGSTAIGIEKENILPPSDASPFIEYTPMRFI
jgi:hypothetical protein